MTSFVLKVAAVLIAAVVAFSFMGVFKSSEAVQLGYRGVAMEIVEKRDRLIEKEEANKVPPAFPPASQDGQLAVDAYKNVQVLGHLRSGEFTRLMTAMTTWVAPKQGCAYCHASAKDASGAVIVDEEGYPTADLNRMDSDENYTKRVARRMLQMTMHINGDWKSHVKDTGVTCYTCHRGNPVPQNIWFDGVPRANDSGLIGNSAGQNHPAYVAGLTSLPSDVLRTFLVEDNGIRVQSTEPLPIDNNHSIKETEWTYGLMMHMSTSLGVNCTHCHNSRAFGQWAQSPPARQQAWYGIRMARDLNNNYLVPLTETWPENRLGPTGDGPKVNCATCHAGAYKPLLGQSMLKDYLALAEAKPQPAKTVVPPPGTPPADGTPAANPATPGAPATPGTPAAPGAPAAPTGAASPALPPQPAGINAPAAAPAPAAATPPAPAPKTAQPAKP